MKEVEKLEERIGKNVELWTEEDVATLTLSENTEALGYLRNIDVAKEITRRSVSNPGVYELFSNLLIGVRLHSAEERGDLILRNLNENKISKEEALKQCKDIIDTDETSVYEKLVSYLIIVSSFSEDLSTEIEKIENCVEVLKLTITDIVNTNLENNYQLIVDLSDLIFPLRMRMFELYTVDILNDESEEFKKVLDRISDFQNAAIEEVKKMFSKSGESKEITEDK